MDEIRRPQSCPGAVERSEIQGTTSSPSQATHTGKPQTARSSPANVDGSGIDLNILPDAGSGKQVAQDAKTTTPAIEAPPKEIRLLGPVPDRFGDLGPAHDYLGKVKSLANQIDLGLYESLFERINKGERGRVLVAGTHLTYRPHEHDWHYLDIASVQEELLADSDNKDHCILIVEAIDETTIQALGMLLNINPCFFVRHLGSHSVYVGAPSDNITTLSDHYVHYLESSGRITSDRTAFITKQVADSGIGGHIEAVEDSDARVSCCQVSKHGWLILVDKSVSIASKDANPFSEKNQCLLLSSRPLAGMSIFPQQLQRAILEVEQQSNIVFDLFSTLNKTLGLSANSKARRNLLLGSEIGCDQVNRALRCFMVLTAWESNTDHIRDLLNKYRHRAIAKPSLETFSPLTWLRRDLAHLDDALVVAKQNLEDRDRDALEALLKNKNSGIKSLDVQYDALIYRVRAMSTTLNNDIQFVIGSVTVHDSAIMKEDSAIMKKQAARATLLTILAAIYLPLTLVTGIFGMNIKEINDHAPSFWACIIGVVVVGGATAAGIFGFRHWHRHHKAKEAQQQLQASKGDKLV